MVAAAFLLVMVFGPIIVMVFVALWFEGRQR